MVHDRCSDETVVLSTHGLSKHFGKLKAVDQLDLSVCRGDIFGFLGPNGAGKTTLIRLIFGLIYPTSGYAQVIDHRVPEQREQALRHMGGFVDDPMFYGNMTARRNLRMLGRMNGPVSEERITEVLEMVGLSDRGGSKVGSYSHGMRQRLGIALALIHGPELIILDEPTSGLDPQGMKDVRELVRELGRQGTTIFLSSHLLHEVELVCNRAAIVRKGRLVAQGPVSQLHPTSNAVKVLTGDQGKALEVLRGHHGTERRQGRRGVPRGRGRRGTGARDGPQTGGRPDRHPGRGPGDRAGTRGHVPRAHRSRRRTGAPVSHVGREFFKILLSAPHLLRLGRPLPHPVHNHGGSPPIAAAARHPRRRGDRSSSTSSPATGCWWRWRRSSPW